MIKVTVLMPVYNGEKYLRESIGSILNQTFKDFEFLIINDGSTDRTKEIILSYNDPRIVYFENEKNIGLTKSLNKGLKMAKGKYIARMDSDDVSLPERLRKQVEFLDENKDYVLVGGDCSVIDEKGAIVRTDFLILSDEIIRIALAVKSCFKHGLAMFRKSTCLSVGGYNEKFLCAQDYDLWTKLVKEGFVCNLPEVLFYRREHSKSVGVLNSSKQAENTDIIKKKYWDSINLSSKFVWGKIGLKNIAEFMENERAVELGNVHMRFGKEYFLRKKYIAAYRHFWVANKLFKKNKKEIALFYIYLLVSPEKFEKFLNTRYMKFIKKLWKRK